MKKLILLIPAIIFWSCSSNTDTEKYQNNRNNIINVKDKIQEINFKDVITSWASRLFIINDYLLVTDGRSFENLLNVFDKNTFKHISSFIERGQGPGEIANMGFTGINEGDNVIYISDHGKQRIFEYKLDSALNNPLYLPTEKMIMNNTQFPHWYQYINDTLSMGVMIEPIGNNGFRHSVAKFNISTGEIKTMPYTNPKIDMKRVCSALSMEHGLYVECYHFQDLISIIDIDGNLICNIYGKQIDISTKNRLSYYKKVIIIDDKILTIYGEGKNSYSDTEKGSPTQFLIFNINGDYIQTLETEYHIMDFCYDKDNNRILFSSLGHPNLTLKSSNNLFCSSLSMKSL